jgi:HdeA/HdeB family
VDGVQRFRNGSTADERSGSRRTGHEQDHLRDWLGYAPADRDFVRFFLSGYYTTAANNNVLDYDRLQKNSEKVITYCKRRKSDTLPTAIQKSAS